MLFQATLQDLEKVYLKFCTALELLCLRNTCRYFYQKIPHSWTVGDLYVTESLDPHTSNLFKRLGISIRCESLQLEHYIYECKFVENIYLNHTALTQVRIGSKLNYLTDMVVSGSIDLEKIIFQSIVPNLKHILINKVPKLKQLELPPAKQLRSINIFNTNLEHLEIHPSWVRLKTIMLVNVGSLHTLHFPKTCVHLEQINISNTRIQHIILDSILNSMLYIQGLYLPELTITTLSVNKPKIHVDFFGITSRNQIKWILTV